MMIVVINVVHGVSVDDTIDAFFFSAFAMVWLTFLAQTGATVSCIANLLQQWLWVLRTILARVLCPMMTIKLSLKAFLHHGGDNLQFL